MKPVFSGHLKINKTKVVKTGACLMQVESIAESKRAFCNTFDPALSENLFWSSFERSFKTGFSVLLFPLVFGQIGKSKQCRLRSDQGLRCLSFPLLVIPTKVTF